MKYIYLLLASLTLLAGNTALGSSQATSNPSGNADQKTFIIQNCIRNLDDFSFLVEQAARLKPFGRVEVNISTLAARGSHDIPPGGSPWHAYPASNPTVFKFVPHKKIAPSLPAEFVKKNRELLQAKLGILRAAGLGAAFWSYELSMLPEAFFEAHPHLRGPRIDHPRRSRQPAYAACIDLPETQQMYAQMMAELLRLAPELTSFFFKTNDAGSGLCWSNYQYDGPNGPTHCHRRTMGQRVSSLLDAFNEGARQAGRDIDIYMATGFFSDSERADIRHLLPTNCHLLDEGGSTISVNSKTSGQLYPLRGLFDPLALLKEMQAYAEPDVKTVFVNFRAGSDRGYDSLETIEKTFDLIEDFLRSPAYGRIATLERLRRHCQGWAAPEDADPLFDALVDTHEAFQYATAAFPWLTVHHCGVSLRYINRPLLAIPEELSPQDEAYFLRHVFNISPDRARTDYTDLHGLPIMHNWSLIEEFWPEWRRMRNYLTDLGRVADRLEGVNGPQAPYFRKVAVSLRIYASVMHSCENFYKTQVIRERNLDKFSQKPHLPAAKRLSWQGEPDLLFLKRFIRDEMENTNELITLLEDGGLELLWTADSAGGEDTFTLGPDLLDQLKKKRSLMVEHYTDAEKYLATPLK